MAQRGTDPLIGFHFILEVSGKASGLFTEIGGLGSETDIIEHKVVDGNGRDFVQKQPGRLKWGDITLKRGITAQMDLWSWRQLVIDGQTVSARANGTITMLDSGGSPVAAWEFKNGWPSKVSGPNLSADSTAFGIEEVTIVHEGITRTK